jgi:hypothetical protein
MFFWKPERNSPPIIPCKTIRSLCRKTTRLDLCLPTCCNHAHAHVYPHVKALHWVPMPTHTMGFGWASVGIGFVHPCIQLQIGVKLLGCREYANQEALRAEANYSE